MKINKYITKEQTKLRDKINTTIFLQSPREYLDMYVHVDDIYSFDIVNKNCRKFCLCRIFENAGFFVNS